MSSLFHALSYHEKLDKSGFNQQHWNKRKLSQKQDVICSRGAASTEVFLTEHAQSIAHCILGAAFPGISVICNSKILSNKMCFFVLFQLLEICIVDVAHSGKKLLIVKSLRKMNIKILERCRIRTRTTRRLNLTKFPLLWPTCTLFTALHWFFQTCSVSAIYLPRL